MRMAKADKEDVNKLMKFLQFMDELMRMVDWNDFKSDWEDDEDYAPIIKHCENENGEFEHDYFMDYYRVHISSIYTRIIIGFDVLVDNCCDPEKDYLDWNPELKALIDSQKEAVN